MSRYISLDWLNAHTNYICERGRKDISRIIYADKLNSAPSIDIEPKRGEWIEKSRILYNDYGHYYYRECSLCGYEREDDDPDNDTNFCPNCGARMKGKDNE